MAKEAWSSSTTNSIRGRVVPAPRLPLCLISFTFWKSYIGWAFIVFGLPTPETAHAMPEWRAHPTKCRASRAAPAPHSDPFAPSPDFKIGITMPHVRVAYLTSLRSGQCFRARVAFGDLVLLPLLSLGLQCINSCPAIAFSFVLFDATLLGDIRICACSSGETNSQNRSHNCC